MSSGTENQLQQALELHRAGKLADAEKLYRLILADHPQQPHATHYLGVIALQVGNIQAAIPFLEQAVMLNAGAEAASNLAVAYRSANRMADAKNLLMQVVQAVPQFGDAWANLAATLVSLNEMNDAGVAAQRALQVNANQPVALMALAGVETARGELDSAIDHYEAALRQQPRNVQALTALGNLLKQKKSYERAIRLLRMAIEVAPAHAEAYGYLALALAVKEDFETAISHSKRAIELAPNVPAAYRTHAEVLMLAGKLDDAEIAARKSVEIAPNFVDGWGLLSVILDRKDDVQNAVKALETARNLAPAHADVLSNLGRSYSRAGRDAESLAAFEELLKRDPNNPDAHGGLSMALLGMGDLKRGFHEYEWRWRCDSFTTAPREFERPLWQGSDPRGRTILVHTEQGYGDVIQFARYLPLLVEAGAKVIVECPLPLKELIERIPGVAKVVPLGLKHPDFDLHLPLLSLPRAFGTTLETIPNQVPYLSADAERVDAFAKVIRELGPGKKVGLMWAGNRKPDPKRTCPFEYLLPLAEVEGVQFISLQKDSAADDLKLAPPTMRIFDIAPQLKSFADTAAVLANLDLMISIDTACCHLAGAVGANTWTLLPYISDWRWLRQRTDCPWYPTMRLFRQPGPNNWSAVIAEVCIALKQFLANP